jgi:hypothetical protein
MQVVLSLAKAAPEAFAPHLEPLVLRIQELWQQGLLAEGERVAWCEGFLAAASGGGMAMQTQVGGGQGCWCCRCACWSAIHVLKSCWLTNAAAGILSLQHT